MAKQECKLEEIKKEALAKTEFIFHNRQRIGDMIMFTCAIRDFKALYPEAKVNVISTAMHIWDNNPYLDRSIQPYYKNKKTLQDITINDFLNGDTNVIKIGPGKGTNQSNRIDWHFANAFRISIEDALGIYIPQGESRGDVWFTEEEYNAPRITEKPYWIIIGGGEKGWGCKMYPFDRWQEFIRQNPDVLFYQLGSQGDQHPRLQGSNIIDYIGKTENKDTGIRDLFKLFLNAEGSIGLVSFHMHLSGALSKPAIVVAGAREPVSFTRYPGHQYLANDGCLPCGINACWHCGIDKCTNLVVGKEKVPKCVDMITPEDLTRALNSYYIGGRLKKEIASEKPKLKNVVKMPPQAPKTANPEVGLCLEKGQTPHSVVVGASKEEKGHQGAKNGKFVKIVSTARGWGGCARSVTTIMKFLVQARHKVEFIPFRNKVGSSEFRDFLKQHPEITVTETYNSLKESCDVLLMYADDFIWEFGQPAIMEAFSSITATRKIMMLNYRRGTVGEIAWTRGWDKYMFLNSIQEKELLKVHPGVKTKVLPPCTELDEFLKVNVDYNGGLRIVRHSSQGDTKFPKDIGDDIAKILERQNTFINMLPGPSFVNIDTYFRKHPRTGQVSIIADFLKMGNLFWYSLPQGYMDMGPRVIIEAMAAGLPIIADNWGGVMDRVTPECGWLCDTKEQMIEIIKNVTSEELERKGKAARARAVAEFIPQRWIGEILE